jgi:hypothetical protein
MSIFKDTFKPEIQEQLKARQEAIFERTPTAIQYYNARNAWIRMSSAVNVSLTKGAPPTNELASKYILQGGILNNNTLKSGVGNTTNNAYSTLTPGGGTNRLGIRPMPGITGIEVKSKSAYGSLREVTVNFNAWDIRQLEDLELLYMRPGYTTLIEWGWAPYLNSNKQLQNLFNYLDIINPLSGLTKEKIFKEIYDTAVKKYGGNYDAMYGYVKNYSWSARPDGGYDCTTTIISIGEVMESLKVNYTPLNNIDKITEGGGLIGTDNDEDDLKEAYTKNILAGLFYEIWNIGVDKNENEIFSFPDKKGNTYNAFKTVININGGANDNDGTGEVGASDEQVYITLESLCTLINNYVTFTDSNSKQAYVTCSVLDREYDKNSPNKPNSDTGEGGYLLCLGHPLQISMDPSVCLINASFWNSGQLPSVESLNQSDSTNNNIVQYTNTDPVIYKNLINYIKKEIEASNTNEEELIKEIQNKLNKSINEVKQLSKTWHSENTISLYDYLDKGLTSAEIEEAFGKNNVKFLKADPAKVEQEELEKQKKETEEKRKKVFSETGNIAYLSKLKPFFYQNKWENELGIIGNIYVNVNFLYRLALNNDLESRDNKEKNDINLYDYLKSVMSEVASSIGNVNNFDIHVDPIDNIIRIIDVNYVDTISRKEVYDNLFILEMHNIKSTVRSYKLESKIFHDQSTTIAIGAQVGGGAMATDNNTMLDFNKGLEDRITPKKQDVLADPNQPTAENIANQLKNLSSIFDVFYDYFSELDDTTIIIKVEDADFNTEKAGQYKNALRDLINFYQNLTKSNIKNRAIIPTKLSITMDGIGGLVIGHIFKIPEDLLPRGYRGETLGSKLGYVVTGIGHSISNNDWTTNIDAQTIILDEPSGNDLTFTDIVNTNNKNAAVNKVNNTESNKVDPNINQKYRVNPPYKSLVIAAKQSIGFSTVPIPFTQNGNVGCAAAVSVMFLRATGYQIHPNKDIELSTIELYNYLSKNTDKWKKRDKWEKAKPGDVIVTARKVKAGHTGIVIDTINADGSYNIISNSSSGFAGSAPGTIQQNYSILKWNKVYYRNQSQTAAFEYIGPYA